MIHIVGGGPAGATCAYYLARKGFDVTLYEKSPNKRKPCGGALSWRLFRNLKDLLDEIDIPLTPVNIVHLLHNKKRIKVKFETPIAYITDRLIFDKQLRKIAKKQGSILINKKAKIDDLKGIVIDARGFVPSKETYFALSAICKLENCKFTVARFSGKNKYGYFWAFPISRNRANIGVGDFGRSVFSELSTHLDWWISEINATEIKRNGWPINVTVSGDIIAANNNQTIIKIGERAGLVDPLIGEGIYYSMKSAKILSDCIAKGNLKEYIKFIKKTKIRFFAYKKIRTLVCDSKNPFRHCFLKLPIASLSRKIWKYY